MLKKIFLLLVAVFTFVSCQFTETLTINEDVSGRMSMNIDMKEMMGLQGGGLQDGRGKDGVGAPKEERQSMQGEPKNRRPSDIGGIAQGSPSSGKGTSMSKKNYPDGITPINFKVVKNILQSAVDHGWKKTKTVEQLRKSARMTVRQAREIVKSEFESVKRWEDGEEKE